MPRRSIQFFVLLFFSSACASMAQTENGPGHDVRSAAPAAENEMVRSEQEFAGRLVELRKAQEAVDRQQAVVASLTKNLNVANQADDPEGVSIAQAALHEAEQLLERLGEQAATALKLHTQAKDKFDISKKKQELASAKSEPVANGGEKPKTPFEDALKRRTQAEQATQEAELAQQQTRTLRDQLNTLATRQKALRTTCDDLERKLNSSHDVLPDERHRLWNERHEYTETLRKINEEIQQVREEILLAEATQRIKEEAADEARTAYDHWKTSLLRSALLLGSALLLVLIARIVLARVIREPERRYTVNKAFSLATTLIVVFGMMFIFAEEFSSLLTLIGFAVAGLAIALQEIVASFAAWFFIRGSRGYTTRDWVQIGNDFGEVVDITFLRTTIQQFHPLNTEGKPVGANPTGGLIAIMNNAVFKNTLINYTRGYPYVWCCLNYNLTFESNWERAREVLQQAMLAEREIVDTARRAKKNIAEMASSFQIKVPSTEPVVRTWVSGVGVELTMRFLAHPRSRPQLLDQVNLRVLRAIQQSPDISFAYWTVRSIATPPSGEVEALETNAADGKQSATIQSSVPLQAPAVRKAG